MRLVAAVVLVALLGGCVTQDPPPPDPSVAAAAIVPGAAAGPPAPLNATSSVDVPKWALGDAWFIDTQNQGSNENAILAVVGADPSAYSLATTSQTMASFDASFDVSYIGKIRASDLAGSQHDQAVQFFSFPLTEGKAWKTQWDQQTISLSAAFAPSIATPLGPQPGFVITGQDASGKTYVTYDYVPALAWWTHLDFGSYGFKVTGVRHNWTGAYAVATSKTLLTLSTAAPVADTPAGTFTVDAGQTSLLLTIIGHAGPFARALVLLGPDHQPVTTKSPNYEASATPMALFVTEALAPTPGQWTVLAPDAHDQAGGFKLEVRELTVSSKDFK
jgi:hypothetical protein